MTNRIVGCADKERLVAYLYGEDTPAERASVEAHLAICRECASEVKGFRELRTQLSEWQTPEIDLGYRVVRDPIAPPRRWWQASLPVWAQAAAAVLVLSAGAGLANLHIEYGANGVQMQTGRGRASQAPSAPAVIAARTPVSAGVDLAAVTALVSASERKLREEFAAAGQSRQAGAAVPVSVQPGGSTNEAMLRQVRALVTDSEQRQQRELALRLGQVVRDVDTQRRADLIRIEQNMGQLEGATGQTADSLREQINYLVRVSQRR